MPIQWTCTASSKSDNLSLTTRSCHSLLDFLGFSGGLLGEYISSTLSTRALGGLGWPGAFQVQLGGLEESGRSKLWLAPVHFELCGTHRPIPPETFSQGSGGNFRDAPAGSI